MRKTISAILGIIVLAFSMPIIFTKPFKSIEVAEKNIKESNSGSVNTSIEENNTSNTYSTEKYNYTKHGTINLLHTNSESVENIELDEYLLGVVSAEMPASFEEEALKAQAVVARTYTIYMIEHNSGKHRSADICDNSNCCQAWISKEDRLTKWEDENKENYWKKIEEAVYSTKGKIVTYNGSAIDAFFHSNSGGKTENVSSVWGGADLPYLQSVETSGEDGYTQYASDANFTKEEFVNKVKEKHSDFTINFDDTDSIKVLEYTEGNRVKTVKVGNLELSGVEVRTILGLKSANFIAKIDGDNINFSVTGYGHGVGMSQTGADALAKEGKGFEDIIKHFYTGVEITQI